MPESPPDHEALSHISPLASMPMMKPDVSEIYKIYYKKFYEIHYCDFTSLVVYLMKSIFVQFTFNHGNRMSIIQGFMVIIYTPNMYKVKYCFVFMVTGIQDRHCSPCISKTRFQNAVGPSQVYVLMLITYDNGRSLILSKQGCVVIDVSLFGILL